MSLWASTSHALVSLNVYIYAYFAGHEKVVSVFPDLVLQLHTTRSWDFLEVGSSERTRSRYHHPSNDVIVGIIDTGKLSFCIYLTGKKDKKKERVY